MIEPRFACAVSLVDSTEAGHRDEDRTVAGRILRQDSQHLITVLAGQSDVEEDDVRVEPAGGVVGDVAVRSDGDFMSAQKWPCGAMATSCPRSRSRTASASVASTLSSTMRMRRVVIAPSGARGESSEYAG